jgi:nitrate reductase / nitrite oxidoreductase, alpha subunit
MTESRALLRAAQFFTPRLRSADGWNERSTYSRAWEESYRRRWQHDRIVRSTHGVNCTGSCSWKVHVKDGLGWAS